MKNSDTSIKEVNNKLLDIERKYDLFDKKVDGVYFWERIRSKIQKKVHRKLGLRKRAPSTLTTRRFPEIKAVTDMFHNIINKNPYLSGKTNLLFYGRRRIKKDENGEWVDPTFDPVIDAIEHPYVYLERPEHKQPPRTDNVRHLDFPVYLAEIFQRTTISSITLSKAEKDLLEKINNRINSEFNIDIDLKRFVANDLSSRHALLPFYNKLIEKIDPDVVFMSKTDAGHAKTLIEASHRNGATVLDFQAGSINWNTWGYHLPGDRDQKVRPDYFLVWGEFWQKSVELIFDDNRVICVGYPYFDEQRNIYDDLDQEDKIVIISTHIVGKRLSKFAVNLDQKCNLDFDIVYKLHPTEYDTWEQVYPWLKNSNVQIIDSQEIGLYEVLASSKIQIGVASTAIYEGLGMGLDTYILDLPGSETMSGLIKHGYATEISTPEEVINHIQETGNETARYDQESIFMRDSANNITTFLNKELL